MLFMRDIRPDLRDRIAQLDSEYAKLQARMVQIEESKTRLVALLSEEDALWEKVQPPLFPGGSPPSDGNRITLPTESIPHLSNLLLEILKVGNHGKEALASEVARRGYPFGNRSSLRAVHFALVGLQRQQKVAEKDGEYYLLEANNWTGKNESSDHQSAQRLAPQQ